MTNRSAHLLLLCLLLGVFGCDHATKGIVEHELQYDEPVEVIAGAVELQYSQNFGVAFNVERYVPARARKALVFGGGLVALALIGLAWAKRYRSPSLEHVAYALIVGGALGNMVDRLVRGYVVDFAHIYGWPIFNVADVAISVGVGVLLWHSLGSGRRARVLEVGG